MPYNLNLAQRIREILGERSGLIEKKMFGGVGFLINGNMSCGVLGNDLIVRVGPDRNVSALSQAFARPFLAPGGKPMAGWVLVALEGLQNDQDLQRWVEQGNEYAQSLPEKK
jgi:TfoX/Sxy family transcriptional regulator of competence genes